MPYIKTDDRARFEQVIEALKFSPPSTPGELNYLFSVISALYLTFKEEARYQHLNDIMGALEGAKLEVYRRIISPYEDRAIKKNGDLT